MKIKIFSISAILFFTMIILSISPTIAVDYTVTGSNFQNIQDSVDLAGTTTSNDRVLLGSTTYTASSSSSVITVSSNKNITIQGQSNANRATLNANNLHGILSIRDGSSATMRYINFVNGGSSGHALGAYGAVFIEHCTFIGSRGDSGSAIYVNTTAPNSIIRNCNFTNNYANSSLDNDYTAGGAVCVNGADNVEILNCYFSEIEL